jgi:hypothetical protein
VVSARLRTEENYMSCYEGAEAVQSSEGGEYKSSSDNSRLQDLSTSGGEYWLPQFCRDGSSQFYLNFRERGNFY